MAYSKPEYRPDIEILEPVIAHLKTLPLEKQGGAVNYTFTKILKNLDAEGHYFTYTYNRSMDVLAALQNKWYRRDIALSEARKLPENSSDVTYKEYAV